MPLEHEKPSEIAEWEGNLQGLAETLHRLKYDRIAEFYRQTAAELRAQTDQARTLGDTRAETLLHRAATEAHMLGSAFADLARHTMH